MTFIIWWQNLYLIQIGFRALNSNDIPHGFTEQHIDLMNLTFGEKASPKLNIYIWYKEFNRIRRVSVVHFVKGDQKYFVLQYIDGLYDK